MKDKFYMLLQTTDDGTDVRVGSINLYYGIRKKKDAEPARKEVLADIQGLMADYHGLSAKDYLGKNKFFVRECV